MTGRRVAVEVAGGALTVVVGRLDVQVWWRPVQRTVLWGARRHDRVVGSELDRLLVGADMDLRRDLRVVRS